MIRNFGDWLQVQLIERDWSQAELGRRAGLTRSAINQYLSGKNKLPHREAAQGLSHALGVSVETIYRAAGMIPDLPNRRAEIEEALGFSITGLTPEQLEEVCSFVQFVRERDSRQHKTLQQSLRDGASHPDLIKGRK